MMRLKNFLLASFFFSCFFFNPSFALSQCEVTIDGYCHLDAQIIAFEGMSAPAISNSGQSVMYFDTTAGKLKCSEDGGSYANCVGGGGTTITFDTVANLPGSPSTNDLAGVTDGSDDSDCTFGGGSDRNLCVWSGSAWLVIGDGAGGGNVSDNTSEAITGVWEIQDDTDFNFGTAAEWSFQYDDGVDDQLLIETTKTGAIAVTDPMVQILVEGSPTADQDIFGVAKGTQGTNTDLFVLDEDGDGEFLGNVTGNNLSGTNTGDQTINTVDIGDVSVTQTEFAELETIGLTTISSAQWTILGALSATLTSTELNYSDGVTSAIQTQIDGKEPTVTEGSLANDVIVEADLKAVNASADEDILTRETTTGDFEWHTPSELITAGTEISWTGTTLNVTSHTTDTSANTVCAGTTTYMDGDGGCDDISSVYQAADADLTDLADGSLTGSKIGSGIAGDNITDNTIDASELEAGSVATSEILDGTILEADLKAVDTASDEECLTYETTTGDFEWQSCGSGGGTARLTVELPVQSAKITGSFVTNGDATQGAGIDAGDGNWRLLFDATTDEGAVWGFRMPNNYSSAPVLKIGYSMVSATTLEVEFEGAIMCVTDGDAADIGTASFSTIAVGSATVPGTVGYLDEISITLTDDSCAANDFVYVYLSTDANDATNDDATGDREVVYVTLQYTGS